MRSVSTRDIPFPPSAGARKLAASDSISDDDWNLAAADVAIDGAIDVRVRKFVELPGFGRFASPACFIARGRGTVRRLAGFGVEDRHFADRLNRRGTGRSSGNERSGKEEHERSPFARGFTTIWLDGEAFPAAARALGIRIVEHEAGGEIVLAPVHGRADEVENRRTVDIEGAAGCLDLLVERLLIGYVIDRISEARAAAAGRRQLDPDGAFSRAAHQVGHAR